MAGADGFRIHTMGEGDLALALDWAAEEGWNPGLEDGACFHAADPGGFLMGSVHGEPVGCISVVRYCARFGFLGFYIVRPGWRGRGYGYRLWQAGLDRLAGRAIGLDGVVAQQANYRRSGFALAHRNVRFGGTPRLEPPDDPRLVQIEGGAVDAVVAYDAAFVPELRERFLRCWLQPRGRQGVALVEDGRVQGYGVIRACRSGFKIGPLFAEDERGAELLFRALAARAGDGAVYLDCPEPNPPALALARRYGLSPAFETARMYRDGTPDLPLARIYGIATFELG
jgi:GNAT superfamily N-acetyltransferase